MKINQRFRIRKDLRCFVVYFEMEGPLEMPKVSAKIIEQLSTEKTKKELISFVLENYPKVNAEEEVNDVVTTLTNLSLI